MHKDALVAIATFVFLFGEATAADGTNSLAAARALWNKTAPKSYSYIVQTSSTQVTICRNAELEAIQANPVRITVLESGAVQVATLRQQAVSGSCLAFAYTIDKLFEYIASESSDPNSAGWPCLDVTYDPTFGFPAHIDHKCELDGDTPITVRDFQVSPVPANNSLQADRER
jgi:hypothetical protein